MKKKILALCLVVVLAITAVTGATLAYFTDTDKIENTFTSGNVKIVQNEKDREGKDFVQDQVLLPIVHDGKDNNGYHTGANYIDKIVTVTNEGNQPAFVRTHLAIPTALDNTFQSGLNILHWNGASANDSFGLANLNMDNDWYWGKSTAIDWPGDTNTWNFYTAEVGGISYNVYVATHKSAVAAGKTTAPSLYGIYLDKDVDCVVDDTTKAVTYYDQKDAVINFNLNQTKVLLFSEAVQAEGFDDTDTEVAFKALNEAFGTPGADGYVAPWNKPA